MIEVFLLPGNLCHTEIEVQLLILLQTRLPVTHFTNLSLCTILCNYEVKLTVVLIAPLS